jgi:UDP-N-acetylmuramoyl-tripeptide--D-alanyl-D-alanine ligase
MAGKTAADVVLFGRGPDVDVRAVDVTSGADGCPQFTLLVHGEQAHVSLRLVGEHHVTNALAAAAVGRHAGMALPEIAAALSQAEARSAWRMEVTRRADGVVVVNDAYNSSPEAVRAALKTLVSMAEGRRTWAVLGEMRELGASSRAEHDAVGRLAVRLGVSRLVVVGDPAKAIHLAATLEGSFDGESVFVPDVETATDLVSSLVRPDDVVLVKASRAVGLERLAASLLEVQVAS